MELSGIDRGKIDSHGRDLSKKMPAERRHRRKRKLMARACCRTTAKSPAKHREKRRGAHEARRLRPYAILPWHCLYFLPLPHGHGSLRPTFGTSSALACGPAACDDEPWLIASPIIAAVAASAATGAAAPASANSAWRNSTFSRWLP